MVAVDEARFEALVVEALDLLPEQLGAALDNVVVKIRESTRRGGLLGRYDGIPLTERDGYGTYEAVPDTVTIYRIPICAICRDEDEVREQVRITVIHELAHHFGIDDDRLDELGWA